jgi:periplasmic divalent cation tolerance protein
MPRLSPKRYVVVLTTCSTRREAERIARDLVTRHLAACVNVSTTPVRSIYRWKGKVEQANEFVVQIKTVRSKLAALQAEIKRLHSYEVPEFLILPVVGGSSAYLTWLGDCLRVS